MRSWSKDRARHGRTGCARQGVGARGIDRERWQDEGEAFNCRTVGDATSASNADVRDRAMRGELRPGTPELRGELALPGMPRTIGGVPRLQCERGVHDQWYP